MQSRCNHRHAWILCELIEEILAEDVFHSPVREEDRDLQLSRRVGDESMAYLWGSGGGVVVSTFAPRWRREHGTSGVRG